jgi:Domain of Unknown Function with PDB structure (DUF3857)/Transglutaminase-like superfamily
MRRLFVLRRHLLILALCSASFHSIPATAAIPPVSPEELAMKSEPLAPGAPAIILYRQVDRDDNGTTSHEENFVRIKILNEEGRKYANVEIPFVKGQDNVVNVKARTIRPDGSVVNSDGKVFEKSLVKSRGVKYLAKTLTLTDVQPGSIIEYSYSYDFTEHLIYDSHWVLSEDLFTKHAIFTLKPYNSSYARFSVRWTWQGLPPGTAPPKEGPDHIIRLEASNIPAFQTEDFMPPATELKSRVDFIYSDDPNDQNPDNYWKSVSKKRYADLEHFVDKRNAMQQAVAQIVTPQDPPEEKLKKLYYRVQQLRNTSYEVSKTEQEEKREQTKKAPTVEDVWSRGYGNSLQLTWLYLALVRAAGMEADGVWVASRNSYFFSPKVEVDAHRLNANLVVVKLNGKDIFCDPGAKFTPFGLLPWYETGVAGLRLEKDGGTFIQTPLPPSSASAVQRKASLALSETGDLEGKLTVTYTGLEAVGRRNEERNEDDAGRKKFLEDAVKRSVPAACEPTLTNQPDWSTSANPLVAEFTLKVPGWASPTGRRVLLPIGLFSAQEKQIFEHEDRVHPIYMDFPFQHNEDVAITVPAGWQVGTLPPEHKQDGHVVTYSLTASNESGSLHLKRSMTVDFLLLDRKYYTALRTFFQGVKTSDDQQVVLQPAATSAVK